MPAPTIPRCQLSIADHPPLTIACSLKEIDSTNRSASPEVAWASRGRWLPSPPSLPGSCAWQPPRIGLPPYLRSKDYPSNQGNDSPKAPHNINNHPRNTTDRIRLRPQVAREHDFSWQDVRRRHVVAGSEWLPSSPFSRA